MSYTKKLAQLLYFKKLDSTFYGLADSNNFWTSVDGLEAGKDYTYYYIVDGQTAVGDPYARLVLDGNNDKYISSAVYPRHARISVRESVLICSCSRI